MKRIGILGGLGPEATLDYYRTITRTFARLHPEQGYPDIVVYSADLKAFMARVDRGDWPGVIALLLEKLRALHAAGADFAAIASNTPHHVFGELAAASPLPLVSIVETACAEARRRGLRHVGLMGTALTMSADFYRRPFRDAGVAVTAPTAGEQARIHHLIFSELELGVFRPETRDELLGIGRRMRREHGIEALVLACTELPLLLTEAPVDLPFLDPSALHCEEIVRRCLAP